MRLTTVRLDGSTSAGRVEGERIGVLPYADVGAAVASGSDWHDRIASARPERWVSVDAADYAPLVVAPDKIICVGANYADHCQEAGLSLPEFPPLFAKFTAALIGANDDIVLPANSSMIDWEVELGVVLGAPTRNVTEEDALDAVAGYTVVNDVSMRDWQLRTSQFLQGKTFEACTPVGPWLVTPEEVDHALDLRQTCTVDGATRQDSSTANMLFGVAHVIAYISSFITLVPGDLIAMGTPAGIGAAQKPPALLTPGSTMTTRIEGLGEMTNRCVAAPESR